MRARAQAEGAPCLVLCAACEAELIGWPPDEAAEYRKDLGLPEPGLHRLIRASYRLLNLITFFTIAGGKESRAWNLQAGQTAYEAAGKVHTDIQRGFIRAEVVPQPAADRVRRHGRRAQPGARPAGGQGIRRAGRRRAHLPVQCVTL